MLLYKKPIIMKKITFLLAALLITSSSLFAQKLENSTLWKITGNELENLGLVVGLSIACSMTIATAVGASVPIILQKLNFDPAISTGPFVTTAIDILGVALYFIIASSILI